MSNSNPSAGHAPAPLAASMPNVVVANKFAMTVQATDFLIWAGTTRVAFQGNGESAGQGVEYLAGLSMSPIAAKQLMTLLVITVAKYEKEFGSIPTDPASEKKFAALRKEKLVGNVEVVEAKKPAAPAKKVPAKKVVKKR